MRAVYSQKPTIHYLPIDEDHPCAPEDAYSLSKVYEALYSR